MDENNNNETQNEEVTVQEETSKKKIKKSLIFYSLVPVAVLMAIQTLAQIPFFILSVVNVINEGYNVDDIYAFLMAMNQDLNDKYLNIIYAVYAVLGITVFGIWYYKGFVKKRPKIKYKNVFGAKSLIAALLMSIGLYFALEAAGIIIGWISPQTIDDYNKLIEMSGLVDHLFILIAYSVFLGPILEELCFRGVVFGILEDSGIRPGLIILISSLLFGAMHITIPLQMLYAALVALAIGFLRYKYRSVLYTVILHILFNVVGTFVSEGINNSGLSESLQVIFGGLALFIIAFVFVLINGDKNAYKPETKG